MSPAVATGDRWWTCPAWCAGDCYGGDTYRFDGCRPYTTSRVHETVRYAAVGSSGDGDGSPVDVTVRTVRYDDIRDGVGVDETTLTVGDTSVEVTADMATALAAVLGGAR